MHSLEWSQSHAVFVTEIDDEHREIFEAVTSLRYLLPSASPAEIRTALNPLLAAISGHFAHEERLMRAARYNSLPWHKQQHNAARKRVSEYVHKVEQGDADAAASLADYLTAWLHNHTRLADTMLGAFLRNHRRTYKVTFRAGTRPAEACTWTNAHGARFDPAR